MSDFLDRMASRSQGASPVLRPRPLSLFEGGPELFEEIHLERDAPSAVRSPAPPRTERRTAASTPTAAQDRIWSDPAPEPRSAAAPTPGRRPPAADQASAELFEKAELRAPAEAAAPAAKIEPAAIPAATVAAPAAAAIVRRRAAETSAALAAGSWSAPEPRVDAAETAGPAPDGEAAPGRSSRSDPLRNEDSRPGAPSPDRSAQVPDFTTAAVAAAAGAAAAAEPAPGALPARTGATPAWAVPPRPAAPLEATAPIAGAAPFAIPPFAPRPEAAAAPVEIRIGRIDIHAAPPAAAAAPVAAPGPSLDAFLARPRR